MNIATTIYIIFTVVLFSINLIANTLILVVRDRSSRPPIGEFISTIFAMTFVVWGIVLLVTN